MEPQSGPKEAPMIENTLARLRATPVTAKIIAMTAPTRTMAILLAFGNIVPMLLAAISELKQAGAKKTWTDNAFGWSNQPEVVLFTGLSSDKASKALDALPVFKKWGAIIGDAAAHWG